MMQKWTSIVQTNEKGQIIKLCDTIKNFRQYNSINLTLLTCHEVKKCEVLLFSFIQSKTTPLHVKKVTENEIKKNIFLDIGHLALLKFDVTLWI